MPAFGEVAVVRAVAPAASGAGGCRCDELDSVKFEGLGADTETKFEGVLAPKLHSLPSRLARPRST